MPGPSAPRGPPPPETQLTWSARSSSSLPPECSFEMSEGCALAPSRNFQVAASHTPLSGYELQACRECAPVERGRMHA